MRDMKPSRGLLGRIKPDDCTLRLRRGRPASMEEDERRRRLVEAAENVFVEQGYSAAATSEIAHRAGMSKKTLYRLFDGKEALFAAVIAARRESMAASDIPDTMCAGIEDLRGTLRRYLCVLARFVAAPRQVALFRLVIAEAHRTPELSRAFYREGPVKGRCRLSEWLAQQTSRGLIEIANPDAAAAMLSSMAIAEFHLRHLLGDPGTEQDIERWVDQAVEWFLNGGAGGNANKKAGQERG